MASASVGRRAAARPVTKRSRSRSPARTRRPGGSGGDGGGGGERAGAALREYAERGVFGGFAEAERPGGRDFEFRWLAGTTFRVRLDARSRKLVWTGVLPDVPQRSAMDRALRAWLRERTGGHLPAHRRIDPRRLALSCTNRGGSVSIALALRRRSAAAVAEDWEYAARKSVSLVNEIFHGFLRGPYHEYMVRNFGEAEE